MSMLWSLLLVLLLTALGWLLSRRTPWGRQLGMTMVVLLLGLLVSNLGGVQLQAEAAGWVNGPLTSLAIGLLLLAVDLRRLWPQARQLLGPFLMAALSTVLGVLLGAWLLHPLLGDDRSVLAGMYTATFTGGSLNFVSVARTLNPPETLLTLATAADYVVFAVWFAVSTWLGLRADTPVDAAWADGPPSDQPERSWWLAGLWGLAVLVLAQALSAVLPFVPSILVLTTVALLVAQLPAPLGSADRVEQLLRRGLVEPVGAAEAHELARGTGGGVGRAAQARHGRGGSLEDKGRAAPQAAYGVHRR